MKDFASLLQHTAIQGSNPIKLETGSPILATKDGKEKKLGKPLNNKTLLDLLKASIPQAMKGKKWGDEFTEVIEVNDRPYLVQVAMAPEKKFTIELSLQEEASDANGQKEELVIPQADPKVVEELIEGENLCLIYHKNGLGSQVLEQIAQTLGFNPKPTEDTAAVVQAMSYCDYPLVLLEMGENFEEDLAYRFIRSMEMDSRRKQFVALVAPGLRSGHTLTAYAYSVNLVVATEQANELDKFVMDTQRTWLKSVKQYHEALKEVGRL